MLKVKLKFTSSRKREVWEKLKATYERDRKILRHRIGMLGVQTIRREIDKRGLVDTGDLKHNIDYKLTKGSIQFTSGVEYSKYLEDGVNRHVMRYLRKSTTSIPLKTSAGTIFRNATEKSMAKGSWVHPGFMRGKGFFSSAVEQTKQIASKEMLALARKTLKNA